MATRKEIVKKLLNKNNEELNEDELMELLFDEPLSVDVDKQFEATRTKWDALADKFTEIAGSWSFIIGFSLFLIIWILLNVTIFKNLDPYPFILLNLVLSCVAALQAPIIMMSQNRNAKKDTLRGKNDYKTDLKSELILEQLHEQINKLTTNQNKILKMLEKQQKPTYIIFFLTKTYILDIILSVKKERDVLYPPDDEQS